MTVAFVKVLFWCVAGFLLRDVPDSPQTVSLSTVARCRTSVQPPGRLARLHVWLRDEKLLKTTATFTSVGLLKVSESRVAQK